MWTQAWMHKQKTKCLEHCSKRERGITKLPAFVYDNDAKIVLSRKM